MRPRSPIWLSAPPRFPLHGRGLHPKSKRALLSTLRSARPTNDSGGCLLSRLNPDCRRDRRTPKAIPIPVSSNTNVAGSGTGVPAPLTVIASRRYGGGPSGPMALKLPAKEPLIEKTMSVPTGNAVKLEKSSRVIRRVATPLTAGPEKGRECQRPVQQQIEDQGIAVRVGQFFK